MIKIFQTHSLKLEIKCNLKKVDYLDITFDLNTRSYRPYRKPNNDARYINVKSNHPPSILKQIPAAISKWISTNSSNKQIFQNAAPHYNNILKNSGHKEKIQFQQYEHPQTLPRRNRSRNIIWFNPSFSSNVETNVARKFLKLVKMHFSKYRYILRKDDTNKRTCNYHANNTFPLDGKCFSSNIVYSADVLIGKNQQGNKYFGICETEFKTKLGNHKNSFKNRQKVKTVNFLNIYGT